MSQNLFKGNRNMFKDKYLKMLIKELLIIINKIKTT